MTAFIWTVVAVYALNAVAACFNLANDVELSRKDRAMGVAVDVGLALWGVYVAAGATR